MTDCCVYFIMCKSSGMVKIGFSTSIENRLSSIDSYLPLGCDLLYLVKSTRSMCMKLEKITHNHFKDRNIKREWFNLSKSECYTYIKNDLFYHLRLLFRKEVEKMIMSGLVTSISYKTVSKYINTNLSFKRSKNVFNVKMNMPSIEKECNMNFSFKNFGDAASNLKDKSKNIYQCDVCGMWHLTKSEDDIKINSTTH